MDGLGDISLRDMVKCLSRLDFSPDYYLTHVRFSVIQRKLGRAEQLVDERVVAMEVEKCRQHGISMIPLGHNDYPILLGEIHDPPLMLFVVGDSKILAQESIAIVGSRIASAYGVTVVGNIIRALNNVSVSVVSGGALGIDRQAHLNSIKHDLSTVCVLGSGLGQLYPRANMDLFNSIWRAKNHLLISEFPFDFKPTKFSFPQRNRIIAGLTTKCVVVEAGQKSGALITAKFALENGRDVFAVPGDINSPYSKGTNQLIVDGATPIVDTNAFVAQYFTDDSLRHGQPHDSATGHGAKDKSKMQFRLDELISKVQNDYH